MKKINTQVEYIPVADIRPSSFQYRQMPCEDRMWKLIDDVESKLETHDIDELTLTNEEENVKHVLDLAQSIRNGGLRISVGVQPNSDNTYELRYGECRWWAHRYLEKETIKASIKDVSDSEHTDEGFMENNLRKDLNVLEKGYGVYDMFRQRGIEWPPEKIANKLKSIRTHESTNWNGDRPPRGRELFFEVCNQVAQSERTMARWLRAIAVSEMIIERVPSMETKPRAKIFAKLYKIEDEELQLRVYEKIHEQGWNVKDGQTAIKWARKKEEHNEEEKAKERLEADRAVLLRELEQETEKLESSSKTIQFGGEQIELDSRARNSKGSAFSNETENQDDDSEKNDQKNSDDDQENVIPDETDSGLFYQPNLYNVKAEVLLSELSDNSVDCILTDPPYGDFEANWPEAHDLAVQNTEEDLAYLAEIVEEWERVLTPNSHIFVFCIGKNIDQVKQIIGDVEGFEYDRLLTWIKDTHSAAGGYWNRTKEQILAYKYGAGGLDQSETHRDVLEYEGFAGGSDEDHIHENQKPRNLLEELIEIATDPGDVVLDPYGGSYATARAAIVTKRKSVSCESSQEIHQEAISLVEAQQGMKKLQHKWMEDERIEFEFNSVK